MAVDQIIVHLAEGFEEIEAVTVIDVLRRAGLNVISVSVTDKHWVKGAHDINFQADMLFDEVDYTQGRMLILPGGMPGAKNLDSHTGLKSQIMEYYTSEKYLAAICAAPMVFGNLGILKGKRAVCYPGFESHLKGAKVEYEPVITSGKIVTGRGVGAALDFSLEIVKLFLGGEASEKLRKAMLAD